MIPTPAAVLPAVRTSCNVGLAAVGNVVDHARPVPVDVKNEPAAPVAPDPSLICPVALKFIDVPFIFTVLVNVLVPLFVQSSWCC